MVAQQITTIQKAQQQRVSLRGCHPLHTAPKSPTHRFNYTHHAHAAKQLPTLVG